MCAAVIAAAVTAAVVCGGQGGRIVVPDVELVDDDHVVVIGGEHGFCLVIDLLDGDEPEHGEHEHRQRLGMGNILVGALVVAALEMGITHFSAEVLTDNRPMRAILDRLGAEWIEEGFGEASASVLLAAPVALLGASEIRRFRQLVATIVSPTAVFAA